MARVSFRYPPDQPNPDPWLTLQEGAAEAKASPQTLRRAMLQGDLRAVRLNGTGPFRLRRSWLTAWLESDPVVPQDQAS